MGTASNPKMWSRLLVVLVCVLFTVTVNAKCELKKNLDVLFLRGWRYKGSTEDSTDTGKEISQTVVDRVCAHLNGQCALDDFSSPKPCESTCELIQSYCSQELYPDAYSNCIAAAQNEREAEEEAEEEEEEEEEVCYDPDTTNRAKVTDLYVALRPYLMDQITYFRHLTTFSECFLNPFAEAITPNSLTLPDSFPASCDCDKRQQFNELARSVQHYTGMSEIRDKWDAVLLQETTFMNGIKPVLDRFLPSDQSVRDGLPSLNGLSSLNGLTLCSLLHEFVGAFDDYIHTSMPDVYDDTSDATNVYAQWSATAALHLEQTDLLYRSDTGKKMRSAACLDRGNAPDLDQFRGKPVSRASQYKIGMADIAKRAAVCDVFNQDIAAQARNILRLTSKLGQKTNDAAGELENQLMGQLRATPVAAKMVRHLRCKVSRSKQGKLYLKGDLTGLKAEEQTDVAAFERSCRLYFRGNNKKSSVRVIPLGMCEDKGIKLKYLQRKNTKDFKFTLQSSNFYLSFSLPSKGGMTFDELYRAIATRHEFCTKLYQNSDKSTRPRCSILSTNNQQKMAAYLPDQVSKSSADRDDAEERLSISVDSPLSERITGSDTSTTLSESPLSTGSDSLPQEDKEEKDEVEEQEEEVEEELCLKKTKQEKQKDDTEMEEEEEEAPEPEEEEEDEEEEVPDTATVRKTEEEEEEEEEARETGGVAPGAEDEEVEGFLTHSRKKQKPDGETIDVPTGVREKVGKFRKFGQRSPALMSDRLPIHDRQEAAAVKGAFGPGPHTPQKSNDNKRKRNDDSETVELD